MLVWFTVLTALIHVAFWGLATRLLDVRQGKRLFGLVGAGEMVASVISGLATPLFVPLWGTIHLLLVAAIGLVGGLVILSIIVRTYTVQIQATAPVANTATSDAVKLLKIPYVRLLFILYLFSVTVLYFLDYGFLDRAQTQFQNEDDLARFFGVFYGISQGQSLLLLTFATGRLFNRFGIRFGMRLRPIVLLVCTLSMVAVGLSNEATLLLFYLAISTKLCDLVLWKSFSSPSSLILYQPLPPDQKLATQLSVETMISPIAGGIAGLALLGLNLLDTHRLLALNASTAILIVGWLLVGMLVFRAYRNVLSEALVRRRLEDNDLSWKESNIIDILHRYLKSPHAGEVIYALDLLEQNDALNNETDLPDLLKHPSPDVRRNALNRMGRLSPIDLMTDVRRQVEMESDPEVLSAALVAWCELGETDVVDDVAPYLDHDTPEVRKGAMVGL
ncbi:MAG: Npt1/Npt2 family nucleotide transporter, partial [Candidatus Latescibacteria bacterium]|nr:Npt1/Npt2 family nucleotide transporter [Candidatus Latescibacterota bacterium]